MCHKDNKDKGCIIRSQKKIAKRWVVGVSTFKRRKTIPRKCNSGSKKKTKQVRYYTLLYKDSFFFREKLMVRASVYFYSTLYLSGVRETLMSTMYPKCTIIIQNDCA